MPDTMNKIMAGLEEALAAAHRDYSRCRVTRIVDGKPVDVTLEAMKDSINQMSRDASPGIWTWESEPDGTATVYAGRSLGRHGMNLFGRIEPDARGVNNLDLAIALVNAWRAGMLTVVEPKTRTSLEPETME